VANGPNIIQMLLVIQVSKCVSKYKFVNAHSGQLIPNLRRKRKEALSGLEGLLEIVGLEVMASVRAGTSRYIEPVLDHSVVCENIGCVSYIRISLCYFCFR